MRAERHTHKVPPPSIGIARQSLKTYRRKQPRWLVFLDLRLPWSSGCDLALLRGVVRERFHFVIGTEWLLFFFFCNYFSIDLPESESN